MASRKHIPRGCRSNYIPGLTDESKSLYEAYKKQYSIEPFGETTIDTGNTLIYKMKDGKKKSWEDAITSTDLTHNSRRAWHTIRRLSNDPTTPNHPCLVNAYQVSHQLLINGQGTMRTKPKRHVSVYCAWRIPAHLRCTQCSSLLHPVFNPVAPYGFLIPNMYLFIADITNPESFV